MGRWLRSQLSRSKLVICGAAYRGEGHWECGRDADGGCSLEGGMVQEWLLMGGWLGSQLSRGKFVICQRMFVICQRVFVICFLQAVDSFDFLQVLQNVEGIAGIGAIDQF